jgi:hypothetical protein
MNFASDLLRSAGKALRSTGRNILNNPGGPAAEIFGTNVPLVPLISYRNHFLRMMSTWSGSIPNQFMWIMLIDHFPPALSTAMLQTMEPVGDGDKIGNNIDKNVQTTTSYMYQKIAGCYFAQGINIPGENATYKYAVTPKQRGFIGGLYAEPRAPLPQLDIQFLETNTSFLDFVIRPWIIMGSHLGLVARPGDDPEAGAVDPMNIKTNMTIIQLAKTYQQRSSVQRKIFRFYNCVPFQMGAQNNPTNASAPQLISTQWHYTHYTVGGIPFIPVEEIIQSFSSGSIPGIINGIGQITGVDVVGKAMNAAKKLLS